jgi:hypothetical protein
MTDKIKMEEPQIEDDNIERTDDQPQEEEKQTSLYAVLQETSGREFETWMYFIRYNGNEEALKYLKDQFDQVKEWCVIDDYSVFDLDLNHLVSEQTAKEMTRLDLNAFSFHRKFDGTLKKIKLKFKDKYSDSKKIKKTTSILGDGKIERYIDFEDVNTDNEDDNEDDSQSDSESSEESQNSEDRRREERREARKKKEREEKVNKLPPAIAKKTHQAGADLPRFAKAKARRH